jgi:hypothetical protein
MPVIIPKRESILPALLIHINNIYIELENARIAEKKLKYNGIPATNNGVLLTNNYIL